MLDRIEKKIISLEETLKFIDSIKGDCDKRFLKDKMYQGALLHNLYLVADISISLAEMILKYKKIPKSESYFESIDLLGDIGVIPADFAYEFAKIASFRNFLAHHYEKIDYYQICKKTILKLDEVREYINYIRNYFGEANASPKD